jgi:hypothetical protein
MDFYMTFMLLDVLIADQSYELPFLPLACPKISLEFSGWTSG